MRRRGCSAGWRANGACVAFELGGGRWRGRRVRSRGARWWRLLRLRARLGNLSRDRGGTSRGRRRTLEKATTIDDELLGLRHCRSPANTGSGCLRLAQAEKAGRYVTGSG